MGLSLIDTTVSEIIINKSIGINRGNYKLLVQAIRIADVTSDIIPVNVIGDLGENILAEFENNIDLFVESIEENFEVAFNEDVEDDMYCIKFKLNE